MNVKKTATAVVLALAGFSFTAAPALALEPPNTGMGLPPVPTDIDPRSPVAMEQTSQCARSARLDGTNVRNTPPANDAFAVDELHKFATGQGVKVAVIDSGVNPTDRLPRLEGGGDFITDTRGLEDCDHHGTLIAGIIGATESPDDGFVGVAPESTILSIRQTSQAFEPEDNDDDDTSSGTPSLATAATAIVHAVNQGSNVINMSLTSCYPSSAGVDTSDVAAALKYAYDRNVVVVTSAGNADGVGCEPNPQYSPSSGTDARNWSGATTMSMPSYYNPWLISVGGSTLTGEAYQNTMTGPWVQTAAPAVNIVSLDPEAPAGGIVNATMTDDGPQPYNGTSFSSAYIAGLAALLKEKYPDDTVDQTKARIFRTAHTASSGDINTVGFGNADPVAALTDDVDTSPMPDSPTVYIQSAGASLEEENSMSPLIITLIVIGVVSTLGIITFLTVSVRSSSTKVDEDKIRGKTAREINTEKKRVRRLAKEELKKRKTAQREYRKKKK